MAQSFHTQATHDPRSWILPHNTIVISDNGAVQTWSELWLMMSNLFHIVYPGNPCSLTFMNCDGHTLELTNLCALQCMGPSCLGSSCGCGTCPHNIWGIYCTPNNTAGHLPYLLIFLWPLMPHSYTWPRSPRWYYLSNSIWEIKGVSDPPSENHLDCGIILLRP